ncbi:hypothetical protein X560_0381 [Listeria fleischmannii 1991]|uniref:Uncharacterized protein n=2 Tax=Listeria fleischmannii TaxID=1069827 RepID=A0A2X3HDG2_9LIST|nr:hypothetical protein [Listeria fleischmannii]EMG27075.1 hypothetical protein LFLEISCH_13010 [Listeria fleischmannii subsp. fleischmannii LU2006-1]KMT60961.1 hypothetical protein X560_0381 [Listeria fleischmannii 1991]SQC70597.1 Uncharacterised protein [Listeria fleischmannii subsp. fleischmannii]
MSRLPILRAYDVLNESFSLQELLNELRGYPTDEPLIFVGKVPNAYQKETYAPMICLSRSRMTPAFRADNQTEAEYLEFLLEVWVGEIGHIEKLMPEIDRILSSLFIEPTEFGIDGERDLDLKIGYKKYTGYFDK